MTVQQSYLLCWELLPDRNRISMGLWYWELMSRPDPAVLPVGTLHSLEWFWVSRRIFIYSHHNTFVFSLRRPFVHGLFVSWGATGWQFVINSRTNIYVTNDCSTVLPPSWYTPLSWMILSKQKNLHLFSSQYTCVFSKMSVRLSVCHTFLTMFPSSYHLEIFRSYYQWPK